MNTDIRKTSDITGRIAGLLVVLSLAVSIALESSDVQSRLARCILDRLETCLGGTIRYRSLTVKSLNAFVIKDLALIDDSPWPDVYNTGLPPIDTIISARSVSGTFSIFGLFRKEGLHLSRVDITDGMLCIVAEENEWVSNLCRFFRSPAPPEEPVAGPPLFDIRRVNADGFRFRFHNLIDTPEYKWQGIGFNWNDLDFKAESIRGRRVSFTGGRLSFVVDHVDFVDKNGFKANHISGKAKCGMGEVLMNDIVVRDGISDINVPKFTMSFKNSYSFQQYVDEVRMDGTLGKTTIDGQTLRYFIDALPDNTARMELDAGAGVHGYVNDLFVDNCRFHDKSGVSGNVSCHLTGLTSPCSMLVKADVKRLNFTTRAATAFIRSIAPSCRIDLTDLSEGTRFRFSGSASGPVNKLVAKGFLSSKTGSVSTLLDIRNIADTFRETEIRGTVVSNDFDLGRTFGIDALGGCSLNTGFRARLASEGPQVILDSLIVGKMSVLGYDYSGIQAAGKLSGGSFDGKVICNDPNLNFLFQGICDFSARSENALYRFYANLGYADLSALKLDRRGTRSKASCKVVANYRRISKGDGMGTISIQDIMLEDIKGVHDIGSVTVNASSGLDGYSVNLDSRFASGSFAGSNSVGRFLEDFQDITLRRHIPALYAENGTEHAIGQYDLSFDFHDSRDLLSFIKPGLYIADSTSFRMSISPDGQTRGSLISPRLAYGANYIKGVSFGFDNSSDGISAILSDRETNIGGIAAEQSTITAFASANEIALGIHINENRDTGNWAEIFLNAEFDRQGSDSLLINVRPLQSNFSIGDKLWDVDSSQISINPDKVSVDGFRISRGDQEIMMNGTYSAISADSLILGIRNLGLSILSDAGGRQLDIPGKIDGQVLLVSGPDEMLDVDLLCDSARVKGRFIPSTGAVGLEAGLNGTNLAIAEPFLKGIASGLHGFIDGEINISGTLDKAEIRSSGIYLRNAGLTLDYTGASYTLDGPVDVRNDGIRFLDVKISDPVNGTGTISGGLKFDRFRKMELDAEVRMNNLQALNTGQDSGKAVYGLLSADADLRVTGPFDNIRIDGSLSTSGSGQVHIPLNSAVASTGSDLLVFKEKETVRKIDPYEEMMQMSKTGKESGRGNIGIHVRAEASPEVTAFMEINKSTGNIITASGTGSVQVDMETALNDINLSGDYLINGGKLHFELPGIVKKEFNLKEGSSLRFNGPVMNSELDITAIYNLKTSLSTLLSDTTSVSMRRPVECSIRLSDRITSPQVSFGVEVPDLDPGSRTKMAEALNTEDKVQKQFIALLVMGSFLPNENSGVVNSANILYSNVGEIMSNQLNNILQRLGIPLDLGLGYQQNQSGTDIFDVAISTQLFNNRVEIGGTVGNRQYSTSKNPNGDMVGDIDISIKLDKSGHFKLNLFSHSADEFTSFLDYSQRNGLGFAYQKEYDSFFKMLKEAFTPKSKRETAADNGGGVPVRTVTIE